MLKELVKTFENEHELPIEIDQLRSAVIELGVQDSIVFASEEMDTGTLRGVFYQYTTHAAVYAEPQLVTLIVYPSNEDICWQRLICAKEIVHVCDNQIVKTDTPEEVIELANKIIGPFEGTTSNITDLMAATDKLAQYQALNLLFPKAAREIAKQRISDGSHSTADIATWAQIPEESVILLLSEEWDMMSEFIIAIGNGDYQKK